MQPFPNVDPIPLPAPIWLFKLLHIVTLSLHFVAVEMLLGGLILALLLSLFGRTRASNVAASGLARRLTVVMTYVINLGVPPLLFSQVLYGRALYTSSVLIGAYWISVILLLMLLYRMLYRFSSQLEMGRAAWPAGVAALLLAGLVAHIYTLNMTLMLRPETWKSMYAASAAGTLIPTGDPTAGPRLLTMMTGGLFVAGVWMIYLAGRSTFGAEERRYLAGLGGRFAAVFGIAYVAAGLWANAVQPGFVRSALATHPLYRFATYAGYAWLGLIVAAVLAAGLVSVTRRVDGLFGWTGAVLVLLIEISFVLYRDAIRDVTLLQKGFDVWNREVVTNWSVVGLFLVLFVAMLGAIGWLISVVARAKKPLEGAAQ